MNWASLFDCRNSMAWPPAASRHNCFDVGERRFAVDFRLALAQTIEIGAVEDVDRVSSCISVDLSLCSPMTRGSQRIVSGTMVMIASTTIAMRMNGAASRTIAPQRLLGHVGEDEQQQPVGRRQQADHDVDHDDHTEMHQVDAEHLGGRDEDRHDDQQDRAAFEQAAEDQQDDIDDQQEAGWAESSRSAHEACERRSECSRSSPRS